jgi:hypothetical protein
MVSSERILIQALVNAAERSAIRMAADRLSACLARAADFPWVVDCAFPTSLAELNRSVEPAIVITSLLNEVDAIDETWSEIEFRLRSVYQELSDDGRFIVFICTVLRHISAGESPDRVMARRIRIRKLNLLAAELSRTTGAFVIDLDRDLADIGAQALETDYRLKGRFAADAAGKSIAATLLSNGLDAIVPFKTQEVAQARLAEYQPPRATPVLSGPVVLSGRGVTSMRSGRRTLAISTVVDSIAENRIGFHVHRLLKKQITIRDAAAILTNSVLRRGLRSTTRMLAIEIRRRVLSARVRLHR